MTSQHPRSQQLIARARALGTIPAAVIYPCSCDALAGALQAHAAGLITPILVGPAAQIKKIAAAGKLDLNASRIEDITDPIACAQHAAALVREGQAEALMKGSLHTDELMTVIVSRAAGLRTSRRISHVFVMDVPAHDRLLLVTDAAVNIAPELRVKADIVRNAIDLAHAIGIDEPRVALLSAVETVNPGIASSVDAAALREMAQRGEITGGIVDGPLAFDNAISAQAARIKGIVSPVCGAVDILVVPALEAGNILYKSLVYLGGALAAGVVMGARVPVILTSRADSPASRTASAAVASLLAHAARQRPA
ncbi:MAG: bifunctional enoyl-CoA hydratase/phosphate acetyltransferase [Pseudomonadota bacterium]